MIKNKFIIMFVRNTLRRESFAEGRFEDYFQEFF